MAVAEPTALVLTGPGRSLAPLRVVTNTVAARACVESDADSAAAAVHRIQPNRMDAPLVKPTRGQASPRAAGEAMRGTTALRFTKLPVGLEPSATVASYS